MWLYLPTSVVSVAGEDSTSLSESESQALAASAMWRSKPRQPQFWRAAWKKVPWMKRLSGVTLEPSTAARGVEEWVASLPVRPVPTTPLPAAAPESSASTGNSGTRLPGSFARWSRSGYFSKMFQESSTRTKSSGGDASEGICSDELSGRSIAFLPESTSYLETWPKWGSMRNGAVYRRQPWAPRTSETAGGVLLWPTPRAEDSESCGNHPGATDSLTGTSRLWTTPQAHDANGGNPSRVRRHGTKHGCANLADDVTLCSTPNVPNGGRTLTDQDVLNRGMTAKGKRQVGLENEARLWATPNVHYVKSPDSPESGNYQRKLDAAWTIDLNSQAAQWATPSARDWKSGDASDATMERNARPLNKQACRFSPPAQAIPDGQTCWCGSPGCALPSHKRKLNPLFTTILMGWPRWWLIPAPMHFARQEMEQWLLQARRRLESF